MNVLLRWSFVRGHSLCKDRIIHFCGSNWIHAHNGWFQSEHLLNFARKKATKLIDFFSNFQSYLAGLGLCGKSDLQFLQPLQLLWTKVWSLDGLDSSSLSPHVSRNLTATPVLQGGSSSLEQVVMTNLFVSGNKTSFRLFPSQRSVDRFRRKGEPMVSRHGELADLR